jgi:hypothetical protein
MYTSSKDVNKRITLKLPAEEIPITRDIMVHVFDNVVTLRPCRHLASKN